MTSRASRLRRSQVKKSRLHLLRQSKVWFILFVISLLGVLAWWVWQPARNITCFTSDNYHCSPNTRQALSLVETKPWIRLPFFLSELRTAVVAVEDDVIDVELSRSLPREVSVEIVMADTIFQATTQEKTWSMLSNGVMKPVSGEAELLFPLFYFESEQQIQSLTLAERQQAGWLQSTFKNFNPRCKRLQFVSSTEIVAEFETIGQVIFKLGDTDDMEKQLATLQAFLRSSTMSQDYSILDVRFDGLAVVKE
jgi:hypothetical protein